MAVNVEITEQILPSEDAKLALLKLPFAPSIVRLIAPYSRSGLLSRLIIAGAIVACVIAFGVALFLIYIQPNGLSGVEVREFYVGFWHWPIIAAITVLVFGYGIALFDFAWIARLVWRNEPNGLLTWVISGAELLLITVFLVEVGMANSCWLLAGRVSDDALHIMHVATFVIAAPLGSVAIVYMLSIAALSKMKNIFPRWLNRVAVISALFTIGPVAGIYTLSGPFNSMNGLFPLGIGAIGYISWVGMSLGWMLSTSIPALIDELNEQLSSEQSISSTF